MESEPKGRRSKKKEENKYYNQENRFKHTKRTEQKNSVLYWEKGRKEC